MCGRPVARSPHASQPFCCGMRARRTSEVRTGERVHRGGASRGAWRGRTLEARGGEGLRAPRSPRVSPRGHCGACANPGGGHLHGDPHLGEEGRRGCAAPRNQLLEGVGMRGSEMAFCWGVVGWARSGGGNLPLAADLTLHSAGWGGEPSPRVGGMEEGLLRRSGGREDALGALEGNWSIAGGRG